MISILIPIYNGIQFISESINSVINQTFTDWELIIGINGHPKNSEIYQKAKTYANNKIMVLDLHTTKGKSDTLNQMIKYSKYDWISLLDVDDIWKQTKLMYQIKFMNNYDVIGTECRYFGKLNNKPDIPLGDISNFDFLKVNPIINSSCLVKKPLCVWNININSGVEDYELWLRLRKLNKRFYNVNSEEVLHRIHDNSYFNASENQEKDVDILRDKYKN